MDEIRKRDGKTTIAPEVLMTIIRMTVLSVPGVSRLTAATPDVEKWLTKTMGDGIKIVVDGNLVTADLYVALSNENNVKDVCHTIQSKVSRAITDMVGMQVGKINIHVEDIDFK
ncbi:MAG TPA: Asp23/Gls24 family envelope stress response protein [Bellilinea sp.]|nr:Asp23/Gls24 family envelope stress response protein [Bellilinea sp.]